MSSYRDLVAWQRAVELALEIYKETRTFPREELFGLTSQMRRCSVSVSSNIAEGQGRRSRAADRHFLLNARGSLQELETQIIISVKLEFLSRDTGERLFRLARATAKPLNGLIRRLDRLISASDL